MPSQEEIEQQQRLLETHRRTLADYLVQQAKLGEAHMPPSVAHGIHEAREHIRSIKAILHNWDRAVEDLPDELEPQEYRIKALEFYYAANWTKCEIMLQHALHHFPGDSEIEKLLDETRVKIKSQSLYSAVYNLWKQGKWRDALEAFENLNRLYPDYPVSESLRQWAKEYKHKLWRDSMIEEAPEDSGGGQTERESLTGRRMRDYGQYDRIIPRSPTVTITTSTRCPICESVNNGGKNYCSQCGSRLNPDDR